MDENAVHIKRRACRALYRQLADLLREQIRSGVHLPGALLPGELELARQCRVGRETVRRAIAILRAEGLVDTSRGHHARVRLPAERTAVLIERGDRAIVRMPIDPERIDLAISEGVPIIEIHRADGAIKLHPGNSVELSLAEDVLPLTTDELDQPT